jgi:hypothetical protein
LKKFLNGVKAYGCYDYEEAVEIGLWHAQQECKSGLISQIILVGDAPPNTAQQRINKRKYLGETYWQSTRYKGV